MDTNNERTFVVPSDVPNGEVCTKPINSKSPLILSDTLDCGPFSFLDVKFQREKARLPPPVYLSMPIITKDKPSTKKQIFETAGLQQTDYGEMKLVDEQMIKNQRGVILDVAKQFATSVMSGKGVVGMSLPVRIFEPRSTLERIVDQWTFAPIYLKAAANQTDPVERIKNVIAFCIAGLYVSVSQAKPFNPLLGETYQATFEDGTEVHCEHTSHHPPIANFYLTNPDFKFYGHYEFTGKLGKNTLHIRQEGPNHVVFNDGSKITFYLPAIKVKGTLIGERSCHYFGTAKFIDPVNKIKAVIEMSSDKKKGFFGTRKHDTFLGKIYYYKDIQILKPFKNPEESEEFDLKYADLEKEIGTISGSFLENLLFDGKEFWNINQGTPAKYKAVNNPLPSDLRFREDLIWLKYGNLQNASDWKIRLEEQQRWDRKNRGADKK